jgi:tRNA(fMet)-specific endonuclease VapC
LAYLIDTNIAIHACDGTDAVLAKLTECADEVLLSVLSLAELQRGVYRDPSFGYTTGSVGGFVARSAILLFDA